MIQLTGKIIKCLSARFVADTGDGHITAYSRKTVKNKSDIVVGDIVTMQKSDGTYVITQRAERANFLIRPPIANTDLLIITVAPLPETDFFLLDKLIINAAAQQMQTVLCVNKSDMGRDELLESITRQYGGLVDGIVSVSAEKCDVGALRDIIKGKQCCFAGQSAVGKSSLVNALGGLSREVGDLSERSARGKNTTTSVELIALGESTYIADTPGFSMLDIHNIDADDLDLYYADFCEYSDKCKFRRCTHTVEPDCEVRLAAKDGRLSAQRYERYRIMKEELVKQKQSRY